MRLSFPDATKIKLSHSTPSKWIFASVLLNSCNKRLFSDSTLPKYCRQTIGSFKNLCFVIDYNANIPSLVLRLLVYLSSKSTTNLVRFKQLQNKQLTKTVKLFTLVRCEWINFVYDVNSPRWLSWHCWKNVVSNILMFRVSHERGLIVNYNAPL